MSMDEAAPSLPLPESVEATVPARARLALDRQDLVWVGVLFFAFAAVRLAIFPFAESLFGDGVVRSEIAERWARDPHLVRSFRDGVYQFGPLQFYLAAPLLWLWPSREHAPRLLSLLFSLATVLPLYRLGRRLFSREAAVVAGLSMAVWGLHIQASTTAASEAIFLALFFFCLDALFEGLHEERFAPLARSALLANLMCALRYDGWLYVPLLGAVVLSWGKDRVASVTRALLYLALCALFPLWWMQGNETATGDALYPLNYINDFHRRWAQDSVAWMGNPGFRAQALVFWPGVLLVTCSALVGVFALVGIVRAFRLKQRRALAFLALVPAAYYTVRGAILLDFSPLARFAMAQVALALFYVKDGFDAIAARLPSAGRDALAGLAAASAVALTGYLGYATAWRTGAMAERLRPISPLSTIPNDQREAARFIKEQIAASEALVVDEAPRYLDLNVAFFTGLPETRLIRKRWEDYEKRIVESPNAPWLLAAQGGKLREEGIRAGEPWITWRGRRFEQVLRPSDELCVFRQVGASP
jgi:4-amino-4-deoxy-L-arabinose transferase-like glycosyltransferase